MKIRVNFGLLILFGIFLTSSIMLNPVLAQIPSVTGVGVKIDTPSDSLSVPVGDLTIYGASSDNDITNCQVYADWNDLKPMQNVTASGPKGDADYSKWSYTYSGNYHDIVEGSNELTSKITCYDQAQNATSKSYSINVTGTKGRSEIVNNNVKQSNQNTVSEDTKVLPVKSSSSNNESSNDTVEESNESTDSEDTNVIPVKNILPLYSESNEESTKSASSANEDETEVTNTDTVELQDGFTSMETTGTGSETSAALSSEQKEGIGESNMFDMSESEATGASDEGFTSHSESNSFFTFEPELVVDEFSNNDENTLGTTPNTDRSSSNYDSDNDNNSIFGLKFNGLDDATKNKIEKRIENLEDKIADRVQLFDLIG
ncbi:MAG: hypothetical protein ABR515_08045 [Nitrososphaeraceae archaeon]